MKTRILNKTAQFLIVGLRPLFGIAHCRYPVSCTRFATQQLQENAFLPAVWAIVKRVFSCNPLSFDTFLLRKNTQDERKETDIPARPECPVRGVSKGMREKNERITL